MANGLFVADIPGAVQRGLQFRQAAQLRPVQQRSAELGLQQKQQALQLGGLQQQRTKQLIGSEADAIKRASIINAALNIEKLGDNEIIPFLQSEIQNARSSGRDLTELEPVLELARSGDIAKVRSGAKNIVEVGVRQGIIKAPSQKQEQQFTLGEGQQRFDPSGRLIAQVAPRAAAREAAKEQAVIPQVLLSGLDPNLAERGAAAFTAAGGGKDGLTAFQKIVDQGTEQQQRAASPQMLKSSFPNASPAESEQLQAAMDAAKTTESGLKEAGKVRDEQRRLTKAKIFQERAVDLLDNLLSNDELDDVIGSQEGTGKGFFFGEQILSDKEAEAVADISELESLLTADNLKLMTGVLSATDLEILIKLSSGALIRTRGEERFKADITELRERLSSELVQTVDDVAEERKNNDLPQLPPSGRQGGELRVDAQGNRAFVFPDGTFEEVQ